MTRPHLFAAWAAVALVAACRPGEGQRCVCEGECRRGLVCAQGGVLLTQNECLEPSDPTPGECIQSEDIETEDNEETVDAPDMYHDLGGKRDFEPGVPMTEDDGGSSGTQSTTTTASTSTGHNGSSSSSSSSGSSSSSSTGSP
jgi:hypothetical protein